MKTQALKTLQNSRSYTLAVAEAMPEKSFEFKPTETVFNFKELMNHITYGIRWWNVNFIQGQKSDWNPPAASISKKEVLADLDKAYAELEETINTIQLSEKALYGFYATLDHITHHRGQATTYLRFQKITPPDYAY